MTRLAPNDVTHQLTCQLDTFLLPEEGSSLLDAFYGVVHVVRCGLACLDSVSFRDGADDGMMLNLHLACKVSAASLVGASHPRGTVQELAQVVQRADEELVLRSIGTARCSATSSSTPSPPDLTACLGASAARWIREMSAGLRRWAASAATSASSASRTLTDRITASLDAARPASNRSGENPAALTNAPLS